MFNSAQCIHELLSILTLVRIHLGFRNILVVDDSWCLVIIVKAVADGPVGQVLA